MAINQFTPFSLRFAGQGVAAFDRDAMLAGRPASMIYFDLAGVDLTLGGMLPSDLDGPPPPAGSPNYYVQMDDDAFGYPRDQLELWRFHADWANPPASTFTGPFEVPVAAFDSNLCNAARACIPQPGTTARLDALADRLMYRLQYRNFGTHESLVVNHTVDVDGSDHAGVRWYSSAIPAGRRSCSSRAPTRPTGSTAGWRAPRWTARAISPSPTTCPARRLRRQSGTPRVWRPIHRACWRRGKRSDRGFGIADAHSKPLGRLQHAQRRSNRRMHLLGDGGVFRGDQFGGVQTRIGAFHLPGCGPAVPPPDAPSALTASSSSSARINLAWTDRSSNESGFSIERCTGSSAACTAFALAGQAGPGVAVYSDTLVQPGTTYSYRVRAFNTGGNSDYSNVADATTQPAPAVTVAATTPTAREAGPESGVFTIARAAAEDTALTVTYSLGGTAAGGTDYVALPGTVTIPAGAATATVTIVPIDDTAIEPDETVLLTVTPASGYVPGTPASATVTIVSDDLSVDLTVTSLVVPATAGAGKTFAVTDTTSNQGTDGVGPSTTLYYLSSNYLLDAQDTPLGTRAVPALAAGATSTASATLTLPADLTPGPYVVFAKADGPGSILETSEINNTRALGTRIGPDLVVGAITTPAAVGAGTPFAVTESTTNAGGGPSGASFTRLYLSANYLLDASDTPLQGHTVPALAEGASSSATTMVTIPAGTVAGYYYLFASADDGNAVAEHTETNNTKYAFVRVGGDLLVSGLTAPPRVAGRSTIVVSDTTKNNGEGAVGPSTTAFYVSSNYLVDAGDVRLAQVRAVPALAAGASSAGSTDVTLPPLTPGTWYLFAMADDANVVAETYETNNSRFTTVVAGPDLTVSALSAPFSGTAGTSITVTDTVRNVGADTAGPSTTRFYLSSNGLLDSSDILLPEARPLAAVGPGATDTGSTSLTLPAGISGVYYIIAVADAGGSVVESSETNNMLVRGIVIGS